MNTNPIESKEAMHGVPKEFGAMLLEITKYVDPDQEEDVMSVEERKNNAEDFDDASSQRSDFFTRQLSNSKYLSRRSTDFGRLGSMRFKNRTNTKIGEPRSKQSSFFGGSVNKMMSAEVTEEDIDDVEV